MTATKTLKSYSSRANARRAISKIGEIALQHAKELITEHDDGTFSFWLEEAECLQDETNCEGFSVDVMGSPEEVVSPEEVAQTVEPMEEVTEPVEDQPHTLVEMLVTAPRTDYDSMYPSCPKCGQSEDQTFNGKEGTVEGDDQCFCHNCSTVYWIETGKEVGAKAKVEHKEHAKSETQADTMKSSLKLNRTIEAFDDSTDEMLPLGQWSNAYQMWKQNPTWMTSGQQDRLTAKLYSAAKEGRPEIVEINERKFQLVNLA